MFEIPNPAVENCIVTFRATMKTNELADRAYLEMWCRIAPHGEAFSKGFHHAVKGTNGWATYETPFFLQKGIRYFVLTGFNKSINKICSYCHFRVLTIAYFTQI